MVVKLIWALLDVLTIIVLGSGLYLWLAKRRRLEQIAETATTVGHIPWKPLNGGGWARKLRPALGDKFEKSWSMCNLR